MTQPADPLARLAAGGGRSGATPAAVPGQQALRQLLIVLFLVRAAISIVDAVASSGDLRPLPLVDPISVDSSTPLWPALWGAAALFAALSLARGLRVGWLLGLAVSVAYLVAGISDASLLGGTGQDFVSQAVAVVVIELGIPLLALASLFTLRSAYLRPSRRSPPTTSPLERWRGRR